MKKYLWLTILILTAGLAGAQTLVTPDGYTMFRKSGSAVYDKNNSQIGSIDGNIAYDASRNELGRLNGTDVTKRGDLVGRIDGNRFNDNGGYTLVRVEGSNILTSDGYTKARIQGDISQNDLALIYYFFMRKK
jgi:hypothetical protein